MTSNNDSRAPAFITDGEARKILSRYNHISISWSIRQLLTTYLLLVLAFIVSLKVFPWSVALGTLIYASLCFIAFVRFEIYAHEAVHGLLARQPKLNQFLYVLCSIPNFAKFQPNSERHDEHHKFYMFTRASSPKSYQAIDHEHKDKGFFCHGSCSIVSFAIVAVLYCALAFWIDMNIAFLLAGHVFAWWANWVIRSILGLTTQHPIGFTFEPGTDQSRYPATQDLGLYSFNARFRYQWIDWILNPHGSGLHLTHHLYPYIPCQHLGALTRELQLPAPRVYGWKDFFAAVEEYSQAEEKRTSARNVS